MHIDSCTALEKDAEQPASMLHTPPHGQHVDNYKWPTHLDNGPKLACKAYWVFYKLICSDSVIGFKCLDGIWIWFLHAPPIPFAYIL